MQADLTEFREQHQTRPARSSPTCHRRRRHGTLDDRFSGIAKFSRDPRNRGRDDLLPGALRRWAAARSWRPYINFTPSRAHPSRQPWSTAEGTQGFGRRQRRQNRRDAHEDGLGADVPPSQLQDPELGRPQHLRQPRRPGARRSDEQGIQDSNEGPGRQLHRRLQTADARVHRVHRIARRLEDRVGPHPLQGLPRHQDDPAIPLARLRFDPGRSPGARHRAADAVRPSARRGRRLEASGVLLQEPDGLRRA